MLRSVRIYKYEKQEGGNRYERVFDCYGTFHQFGVDYEEFETGPGNYSTAIVELTDGSVRNVPVAMVEFMQPISTIQQQH